MNHYQKVIIDEVGCTPETAVKLEELMRVRYPTLDHLTLSDLKRLARVAYFAWLHLPTNEIGVE